MSAVGVRTERKWERRDREKGDVCSRSACGKESGREEIGRKNMSAVGVRAGNKVGEKR